MQSAWKNAKYVDILYSYTCMIIIFLCTKHKGQCGISNFQNSKNRYFYYHYFTNGETET